MTHIRSRSRDCAGNICGDGVYKNMKPFTQEDISYIRALYPSGGWKSVHAKIGHTKESITGKAQRLGVRRDAGWSENKTDMSWLMEPNSPRAAYVLGMIWADGSLHYTPKYSKVSVTLVGDDFSDIADMFDEWRFGVLNITGPYQVSFAAVLCHKRFCDFLRHNDYLVKSNASPNKILSRIPFSLHRYFYRGWFDGDGHNGCLDRDEAAVCIAGSIHQDWKALADLCKVLDISHDVRIGRNKKGSGSVFVFNGQRSTLRFMRYVYAGETFGLQRKRQSWELYHSMWLRELDNRVISPIGVYHSPCIGERYNSYFSFEKKRHYLGAFGSVEEAAIARDDMCFKLTKDETKLNYPTRVCPSFRETFGVPQTLLHD